MDLPGFIVYSFIENYIGVKRVKSQTEQKHTFLSLQSARIVVPATVQNKLVVYVYM